MTNFDSIKALTLKTNDDGTTKNFARLPKASVLTDKPEEKAFFSALTNAYQFLDKFATKGNVADLNKGKDILKREVFAEIGVPQDKQAYYTELSAWSMNPSDKKSGFTTVSAATFKKHTLAFCGLAVEGKLVSAHASKNDTNTQAINIKSASNEDKVKILMEEFNFSEKEARKAVYKTAA